MSATNLDASDLHLANLDGVINESVLQAIFDISNVELPFTQRAASGSHDNQYHSWRMDKLADPVIDGQLIKPRPIQAGKGFVGRRVDGGEDPKGDQAVARSAGQVGIQASRRNRSREQVATP